MIALLVGLMLLVPSPQSPGSATLRVTSRAPLVVLGTGFKPRERVLVMAASRQSGDKRIVASATGTFVVRFDFGLRRCTRVWIRAIGTRGTHARYAPRLGLDCMPDD